MWTPVVSVLMLACSLVICLDSNGIRSSQETLDNSQQQAHSHGDPAVHRSHGDPAVHRSHGDPAVHRSHGDPAVHRSHGDPAVQGEQRRTDASFNSCRTPDCFLPERDRCSNRAQRRRLSPQDRQTDGERHRNRQTERERDRPAVDFNKANRTKAPEMSSCVRSADCEPGLCCVRYLAGKRCQRIPLEGDACLLRRRSKVRRNLERCDCGAGLSCSSPRQAEPPAVQGQGVCVPRHKHSQRNTRHSGKRRRTAEGGC